MTTYKTETTIPVEKTEASSSKGWLLGAGLLALGALIAGAALLGDDDYDQIAYNDDVIVTDATPVAGAYIGDDDVYVSPTAAATVEELLDDDRDYGTVVVDNDELTNDANMIEAEYDPMYADMDDEEAYESDMDDARMTQQPRTAVMGAVETAEENDSYMVNDTVGELLQAGGDPVVKPDNEVLMADGHTIDLETLQNHDQNTLDNAIVVPGSNDTLTTVMCPAGTTAQTDMTCEITGDYEAELIDEDRARSDD